MFVLARALGPTGRGEVAAALAPMTAASAAFAGGLPDAVSHFVARFPTSARKVLVRGLWMALVLGVLAAATVASFAGLLGGGNDGLAEMIMWVGLATIPTIGIVVLRAHSSGRRLWRRVSFEAIIAGSIQIVGLTALWALGQLHVQYALIVMVFGAAAGGLVYIGAKSSSDELRDDEVSYEMLGRYSAGAWLGAIGMVGMTYLDQMLMTPLSSVEQLGIYALAINIASLLSVVTVSIRSVVLVNESAAIDFERLARHARFSLVLSLVLALATAVTLPFLVPLIFGDAFAASVVPALLLLPPLVITASGSVATAGLMALGRPWLRSISIAIGMVLNVVLVVLLVPPFGAIGAALAMLASAIPPLLSILFLRRYYGLRVRDFLIPRPADVRGLLSMLGGIGRGRGEN